MPLNIPKHSIVLFHSVSESLFDLEHILAIKIYIYIYIHISSRSSIFGLLVSLSGLCPKVIHGTRNSAATLLIAEGVAVVVARSLALPAAAQAGGSGRCK